MNVTLLPLLTNTNNDIMIANVCRLATFGKTLMGKYGYSQTAWNVNRIMEAGLVVSGEHKLDYEGIEWIQNAVEATGYLQQMFDRGQGNNSQSWWFTPDEFMLLYHVVTSNVCAWLANEISTRGLRE